MQPIKAYLKATDRLIPVTIVNTLLNDEGEAIAIYIDHERNILDDAKLWNGKDWTFSIKGNESVDLADKAGLLDLESLNELRKG